eukprot:6319634-Amphidinium_carterae.2
MEIPLSNQLWPSPAPVTLPPLPAVPAVHYGGSGGHVPVAPSINPPPPPPLPGVTSPAGSRYVSNGVLGLRSQGGVNLQIQTHLHLQAKVTYSDQS